MDELQRKLSQRHDSRSQKVRFKISSAYSGRVLKQVYEDGQELEIPQEECSHSFRHWDFEPRDNFFGIGEGPGSRFCPPAKLNAQRISVFREGNKYTLTGSPSLLNDHQAEESHMDPPILDFGKIIIYTSNLKIIRTPMNKKELVRKIMQNEGLDDWSLMYHEGRRETSSNQSDGNIKDTEYKLVHNQPAQIPSLEFPCMLIGSHHLLLWGGKSHEELRERNLQRSEESGLPIPGSG
ncbi:glutaredoxin domain-containing cysteine-rich protein 2 isoform X2 [Rhineura floridana]|uniref:glutaredoxin domain-containing cysteine-rich protein 2 isoform X2 n=1 Tax=Rhineura floridana TaxID=261503 RepID=UPI002AC86063|nr:glutaredoxin domain-containing cysteine-rich protein 2 isoform X2 [Rhineura floridana]